MPGTWPFVRLCSVGALLLGPGLPAPAQAPSRLDSLQAAYPFLHTSANRIEQAREGLPRFYQRLAGVPSGPARVSVLHLGDSHVQADLFPGQVRQELQRAYGHAGRGLVFPYRLARTVGAGAVRTRELAGHWRARSLRAAPDPTLPIGLSGFALATADTAARFGLTVRPPDGFSKITLIRSAGPRAFDWQVLTRQDRLLGIVPGNGSPTLTLDSVRSAVELRAARTSPGQTRAVLHGLLLDNGQPGVVYHTSGVNGAAVRDYLQAPLFFAQLPLLEPDLIIVSLGTNDAYKPGFHPALFIRQLDTLVSRLRRRCTGADVLLTAPPESLRAHGAANPDLPRLRAALRAYCQANKLAYWDFAAVQGGARAMRAWQAHGLAQPDGVHFTAAGYRVQGLLLYLALQDGFASQRF
ncbi:GDSL-type esterase/lipase family protein [Hymenobacter ruricola]|uniref:SGNH hydrolase-type esterase domain-containing protein n=1 Tax=Hymenobacter ruricola TaxID=2791023 RepID=A0ABS0I549_9BACT|nr:GDSL-type esterase/lipase family protein [Hymenobacter ruricola]MBF9222035.1 hypothetical protein [Hymenobacter ruricola]